MSFMDNYEGNRERTDRWIATFPLGRLETQIIEFNVEQGFVLVQAKAWRNQSELEPAGVDYAFGYRGAYKEHMKRWFVEDTVTSALMRVMALVMGAAEKSTKETMQQVDSVQEYDAWSNKHGDVASYKTANEAEMAGTPSVGSSEDGWITSTIPSCQHGEMRWNQSKPDAAKDWAGYFCTEKNRNRQCNPAWYVLTSDGTYKPQV